MCATCPRTSSSGPRARGSLSATCRGRSRNSARFHLSSLRARLLLAWAASPTGCRSGTWASTAASSPVGTNPAMPIGCVVRIGCAGSVAGHPECLVYVSWDGTKFAGAAVDRRPHLTGGEVIITAVPISINGPTLEANLPYSLIGDVPVSFVWGPSIVDWAGTVGSGPFNRTVSLRLRGWGGAPSKPPSPLASPVEQSWADGSHRPGLPAASTVGTRGTLKNAPFPLPKYRVMFPL